MQQQQQQGEVLEASPEQQSHFQPLVHNQNLPMSSSIKLVYEPGTCARLLAHYLHQMNHRPHDNNIEFWRKFTAEFFSPDAKKRCCFSMYGKNPKITGVYPQEMWHCEMCNLKPGCGFEISFVLMPRLFKIKYDSGTLDELLYIDTPSESQNESGQIVLDYAKAIQASVFEKLRVVHDGQLRIVFSKDLKICSWEFCARRHEELITRRSIMPRVSQLGRVAQNFKVAAQIGSSNFSSVDLKSNCDMFVASARRVVKALEVPLINDLGYAKRYVRCLQISEVIDRMKDLMDYSRKTGIGPQESLMNFPRATGPLSGQHRTGKQPEGQLQEPFGQQTIVNDDDDSAPATFFTHLNYNDAANLNNLCSQSTTSITELLHQTSLNSGHKSNMMNPSSPFPWTPVQIPSALPSTILTNLASPFSAPTPFLSNNPPQATQIALTGSAAPATIESCIGYETSQEPVLFQWTPQSNETGPNEPQSTVDKIIQEVMNSPQFNGTASGVGAGGSGTESIFLAENEFATNNSGFGGVGFGNLNGGVGSFAPGFGIEASMDASESPTLSGNLSMPLMSQDTDVNYQQPEFDDQIFMDCLDW